MNTNRQEYCVLPNDFSTLSIDPHTAFRYTHIDYRIMSPQKVVGFYDSDRSENGWRPPLVDNRKLDALREADRRPIMLTPRMPPTDADVYTDLGYLYRKAAEISRHLGDLGGGGGGGYSLRSSDAASAHIPDPNKLSMYESFKRNKSEADVKRLTDDQVKFVFGKSVNMFLGFGR